MYRRGSGQSVGKKDGWGNATHHRYDGRLTRLQRDCNNSAHHRVGEILGELGEHQHSGK